MALLLQGGVAVRRPFKVLFGGGVWSVPQLAPVPSKAYRVPCMCIRNWPGRCAGVASAQRWALNLIVAKGCAQLRSAAP